MEKSQRIIIQQVALVENGNEVQVVLKYAEQSFEGRTAVNPNDGQSQLIAATRAAVDAVNSIIPTPIVTRVAEIQEIPFKDLDTPVIVVLVGIKLKGQEVLYSGSAKSAGVPIYAAVRATLDAINRPIGLFMS